MRLGFIYIVLFFSISSLAMDMSECKKLSAQADQLSSQGKKDEALDLAVKVVNSCKPAPYNALMVAGKKTLHHLEKPKESLKYFNQAIKQGPDYYMGYLNASAAYMGLENYDKAIEHAKLAVDKAKSKKDKQKGRYNLGLAYFKKAAPTNDKENYTLGYEQFKQTVSSSLFKTTSHYFMALYEEVILHDEEKARANYTEACKGRHQASCQTLPALTARMAPYKKSNYKPAGDFNSLNLAQLSKEMKECYKAKYNMEDGIAERTVASITGSFQSMDDQQKKKMYISTLNSIGCK